MAVFNDPFFFEVRDEKHSTQREERFLGYGIVRDVLVVATVFTERSRIRLISVREADKDEEATYYERRFSYE